MPQKVAEVWTKPFCSTCQEEKTLLRCEGYEVREIIVTGKTNEDMAEMDRDAFAQLHIQDGMFPVVRVGGKFRTPAAVSKEMAWK